MNLPTPSSAIRAAAEELFPFLSRADKSALELARADTERIILKHLSPILNPPAGEIAKRAAIALCEELDDEGINVGSWCGTQDVVEKHIADAISQSQAPLVERVRELERALRPFADGANWYKDECPDNYSRLGAASDLTVGHLRAARQALTPKEKP